MEIKKDITDLRNRLLSAIVESSDDAIISKDLTGTITSWNLSAERIFGYKESEAIGKSILIIIPDEKQDEEKFIISSIKAGKKVSHFETVRKRRDGSLFPASITVSPVKDDDGDIIGASKILRDITEKKLTDEKNARLLAIIESSDDAIISKNLDGIITSWNPAAERIFGYTEDEMIGQKIIKIFPKDRLGEEIEILEKVRNGIKVEHYETVRVHKNGTPVNVSITVSPIRDTNGTITGVSKIARDITGPIATEKKLKEQTRQLKQLNASKDEFIGIASHELKTPLTSIKAYLQLIERSLENADHREYVGRTLNYISKLETLVGDLLDVSKIQAGKLQMNILPFDLTYLLKQTLDAARHTNPGHDFILDADEKPVIVEADRERIEQVINNFLTNAVKYAPDDRKVIISLKEQDKRVTVSVKDFGIGIDKKNIDKIFSRFYRVEGLSPQFSGLGIGLYISSEIITRHHGSVWVESEAGQGSTFFFSIPCRQR